MPVQVGLGSVLFGANEIEAAKMGDTVEKYLKVRLRIRKQHVEK